MKVLDLGHYVDLLQIKFRDGYFPVLHERFRRMFMLFFQTTFNIDIRVYRH